jgi:hypothetical protein
MTLEIPITKLTTVGRTVHVLAARTLIRDLEQGTSHRHYRFTSVPAAERSRTKGMWGFFKRSVGGTGQDKASAWSLEPVTPPVGVVKREIVELGVRYQLVSSETSFVAVERWLDGRRGDAAQAAAAAIGGGARRQRRRGLWRRRTRASRSPVSGATAAANACAQDGDAPIAESESLARWRRVQPAIELDLELVVVVDWRHAVVAVGRCPADWRRLWRPTVCRLWRPANWRLWRPANWRLWRPATNGARCCSAASSWWLWRSNDGRWRRRRSWRRCNDASCCASYGGAQRRAIADV